MKLRAGTAQHSANTDNHPAHRFFDIAIPVPPTSAEPMRAATVDAGRLHQRPAAKASTSSSIGCGARPSPCLLLRSSPAIGGWMRAAWWWWLFSGASRQRPVLPLPWSSTPRTPLIQLLLPGCAPAHAHSPDPAGQTQHQTAEVSLINPRRPAKIRRSPPVPARQEEPEDQPVAPEDARDQTRRRERGNPASPPAPPATPTPPTCRLHDTSSSPRPDSPAERSRPRSWAARAVVASPARHRCHAPHLDAPRLTYRVGDEQAHRQITIHGPGRASTASIGRRPPVSRRRAVRLPAHRIR